MIEDKYMLNTDAVSEILGSMLLVLMAVAMFSIVYSMVLSMTPGPSAPQATLAFSVDVGNITINHCGGEALDSNVEIVYIIDNQTIRTIIKDNYTNWDNNSDGKFNLGEQLVYPYNNILRRNLTVEVIDPISNSIIMTSRIDRKYILPPQINTHVDPIVPYKQGDPTLRITVSGDYRLDSVGLYYRYSTDNSTWSLYTPYGAKDTIYPWVWDFNFPDGVGYYEFYSIGSYNGNNETPPSVTDARCYWAHKPVISNVYPSDGATGISLNPTLHITVSDGDGDSMNITWYTYIGNHWSVIGTNNSVGNGTYYRSTNCFNNYGYTYYWRVTVDDGIFNVSETYHFTTRYPGKPVITNEYPSDGATNVPLNPTLSVTVTDPEGDSMNITWYAYNGSSWDVIGVNNSVHNGTYYRETNCFNDYGVTYQWRVTVDDGTFNVSESYKFTTEHFTVCEDFSLYFPALPSGWTQEEPNEWRVSPTDHAGGVTPEARLYWYQIHGDYSYLQSKPVDTSNVSSLKLSFNQYIDDYRYGGHDYFCRVYTRANSSDVWTLVAEWDMDLIKKDVGPQLETFDISCDIGTGTQIKFEFEGDDYDINYWYIDDVCFDGTG